MACTSCGAPVQVGPNGGWTCGQCYASEDPPRIQGSGQ